MLALALLLSISAHIPFWRVTHQLQDYILTHEASFVRRDRRIASTRKPDSWQIRCNNEITKKLLHFYKVQHSYKIHSTVFVDIKRYAFNIADMFVKRNVQPQLAGGNTNVLHLDTVSPFAERKRERERERECRTILPSFIYKVLIRDK